VIPDRLRDFIGDRIQLNSLLIVLCFASVLSLGSQSAASYPTYFLALSMLLTVRQWNDVSSTPFFWCVAVLVTYLCMSSFWSDPFAAREALGIFGRGLLVMLFVVAMAECQLRGHVQLWLGRALAVVGAIAATVAFAFYLIEPPPGGRLSGLGQLDNPVVVGLVFGAVLILLTDIIFSDPQRRWKVAAATGAVIAGGAIYLAGSRNAWISVVFGLLILLFARRIADRQRFLTALTSVILVLAVIVATLMVSDQGRELLLPRGDSYRPDIWMAMLHQVLPDHLAFGKGILTPDRVEVGEKCSAIHTACTWRFCSRVVLLVCACF